MSPDVEATATANDPLIGTLLGNFRVEQRIAAGGMGLIYRAVHTVIGRQAAIKVLSKRYSRDENMIKRLHREARAVNRIGHRNIVDIFDFGRTPDGREYFVMEYLSGNSLAQIFEQRGRQPWAFHEQILAQLLAALGAAHDLGIVHRDIKPENVLVMEHADGTITAKVLDFGIAKSVGVGPLGEQLTRAGSVMGTPEHIAPEQIRGRKIDGRADLYAVGTIVYEMASGRRPFEAEQVVELLMKHLRDPPPPLGEIPLELGFPADIEPVLQKALAKDPADRYQDARSFARALGLTPSNVSAADGTRELPEMFWQMHGPQSTGAAKQPAPSDLDAPPREASLAESPLPGVPVTGTHVAGTQSDRSTIDRSAPALSSSRAQPARRWLFGLTLACLAAVGAAAYLASTRPKKLQRDEARRALQAGERRPEPAPSGPPLARPLQPNELEALLFRVREALREELRDPDSRIRRSAVRGIGHLGDHDAKLLLLKRLTTDPDPGVRAAAALALARLGDKESVAALLEARGESSEAARVWIDEALLHLGDDSGRRGLEAALDARDPHVRFAAAIALAETGNPKAAAALMPFLQQETSTQKLATTLYALARLGNERAVETLREGLGRPDREVKLHFAEALGLLGDAAAPKVLGALLKDADRQMQLMAARALATIGDDAGLDLMRESLRSADPAVRLLSVIALGAVADQIVLQPLVGLLDDRDGQVRAAAAESIAKVLGLMPRELIRRSQSWLLAALENRDWSMRYAAVGVTTEMDPELAVELLAWAFQDEDDRIRAAAIASLGKLRHRSDKALRVIKAGLGDSSPLVRKTSAVALREVAGEEAKTLLAQVVHDATPAVGMAAAGQLLATGDVRYLKDLQRAAHARSPELRAAALEALGYWEDPRASAILREALRDPSPGVRFSAALQLGRRADRAAIPVLTEMIDHESSESQRAMDALVQLQAVDSERLDQMTRSPSPETRMLALRAAPRLLTGARASALARQAARDSDARVRRIATTQLGRLAPTDPNALVALQRLTSDPDPAVRALAALALSRGGDRNGLPPLKPLREAPVPAEPVLPTRAVKPEAANKARPDLWLEDSDREGGFKRASATAAALESRGKLEAALARLKEARTLKPAAASVQCDLGRIHIKLALRVLARRARARRHISQAKYHFETCRTRSASARELASVAERGLRDVKRLAQRLR